MISTKAAILCDAASIREGLLHVLGGGITVLGRESYPAPLSASLALLFELTEVRSEGEIHDVHIRAHRIGDDGRSLFELHTRLQIEPGSTSDMIQSVPLLFNLTNAGLPEPGSYEIEVSVDNVTSTSVRFNAALADLPDAIPMDTFA